VGGREGGGAGGSGRHERKVAGGGWGAMVMVVAGGYAVEVAGLFSGAKEKPSSHTIWLGGGQ